MTIKRKHNKSILVLVLRRLFIIIPIVIVGCSSDETQTVATFDNLVFEDEFEKDGGLNTDVWNYEIGDGTEQGIPGWGNNELQYYTDRTENVSVQNGYLLITAKEESFNGSSYTSARLNTKGKFEQKYGRFEARIRLPYGQGMWPAFWLLGSDIDTNPWPCCGEIDIMENRGQEPTLINGSLHGPGYNAGQAITKAYELSNDRFDTGFHIFGIEWGPDYINYYVDDVLYNQITPEDLPVGSPPDYLLSDECIADNCDCLLENWNEWVFNDRPFYIIINLAVGGSYVGSPNAETEFPQTMLVDYVRVYEK